MGTVFVNRISGDRMVIINEAIKCYELALEIRTRETLSMDWAKTQMSMARALQLWISGDRQKNINDAIECYKRALEIRTRESLPRDWAKAHLNLGAAYISIAAEGEISILPDAKRALENFFI